MASINDLARSLRQYFLPTKSTFTIGGSIFLDAASSYDLGSSTAPFRAIYADSVIGTIGATGQDYVVAFPTNDYTINRNGTYYSVNFGIVGDTSGALNEGNNIANMLNYVGLHGGGHCVIRAVSPTDVIFIDKIVTCAYSNVQIEFRSPVVYGASGSLRVMGAFDEFTRSGKAAGKLASNAAAGGFTLTLSTSPSSMQSSDFLVGDRIVIRGENDVNGKAIERQICFITAINNTTHVLTVSEELDYTFKTTYPTSDWPADTTTGTTIYVTTYSIFTGNVTRNSYTAVVGNASLFAIGDLVMVGDSRNENDMNVAAISGTAGPYVNPANLEFATIADIDYTSNTITFDHALRRSYLYAAPYYGGVTKVVPVENSTIQGAHITYSADQTSKSVNSLQITYAQNCHIFDCVVSGLTITSALGVMPVTSIGRMGQALRIAYSYRCSAYHNNIHNAAHTGSGEGYGITIYYATAIQIYDNVVSGCRHNYLTQLATLGDIYGNVSIDDRISGIDLHGVQDQDCHIHGNRCVRGVLHTGDATKGAGIRNGNTSHAGGSHNTLIENNYISGYTQTDYFGIDIIAASKDCIIRNNTIVDCYYGIGNSLNSSQVTPVQDIENIIIEGNTVTRATQRAFVFQAKPYYDNTNSNGMIYALYLVDNISDGNKHHFDITGENPTVHSLAYTGINNVMVMGNKVVNPDTGTANIYALNVTDAETLRVYDNNFSGANKGISITRVLTLLQVHKNILTNLVNTTAYNDGGGNVTGTFNLNITNTGVGIGTPNPGHALQVGSFNTSGGESIESVGATAGLSLADRALTSWPGSPVAGNRFVIYPNAGNLYIYTDVAGNLVTIDSAGGMTLAGGQTAANGITSTGSNAGFVLYNRATNAQSVQWYSPTAGALNLFNHAAGTIPMTIDTSGNLAVTGTINGGTVIKHSRVVGSLSASQTMTANIDVSGNSVPVITDGTQIVSVSYSPTAASKVIEVRAYIPYLSSNANTIFSCTLWAGSTCIAQMAQQIGSGATSGNSTTFIGQFTSVSSSALTIQLRIGPNVNTTTLTLNPKFGNASNTLCQPVLYIDEYV